MKLQRLVDWPHVDEPLWSEDDLTVREWVEGTIAAWWDGSWIAMTWWDLRNPPLRILWTPWWRRRHAWSDGSWDLNRWNPVFWLVVIFGEK